MPAELGYAGKRVVVVGGGGAGMGAATARLLTDLGAEVHVVDLKEPEFPVASHHAVDLRDPSAIDGVVAEIGGPVHSLFYCAGLPNGRFSPRDVVTVNFLAMRRYLEQTLAHMPAGSTASAISSIAGNGWVLRAPVVLEFITLDWEKAQQWCDEHPDEVADGYVFSKEAVVAFVHSESVTLASRPIRLNCTSPGSVQTPMIPDFVEAHGQEVVDAVGSVAGRMSAPEEQAWPLLFLNSDLGSYLYGANVVVDGGYTAGVMTGKVTPPV